LWNALAELRRGRSDVDSARRCIRGCPWVLGEWADALIEAATSQSAAPPGERRSDDRLIRDVRLEWSGFTPSPPPPEVRTGLNF